MGEGEAAGVPELKVFEDVEAWLKRQPRAATRLLAARAAMRVLPLVQRSKPNGILDLLALAAFRACATGMLSASHDPHYWSDVRLALFAAKAQIGRIVTSNNDANFAIGAAVAMSEAAVSGADDSVAAHAAFAISVAASRDRHNVRSRLDLSIYSRERDDLKLRSAKLWLDDPAEWSIDAWDDLCESLSIRKDWQVWIDWYEARLRGDPYDEALEECYVLIPEEIWAQGPAAANAEIARRVAAYRERQAAALAQDPRGGRFVAGETGLALRPGDEPVADEAAAMAPHVAAALARLLDRLRLSNRTPPGLMVTVATLLEIVESGSDAARARAFEMWTQSLALAQGRARDDDVKADAASLDEPLDPDSRSALELAVAAVAVYARAFDEVRRFDEALQGFDAPVAKPATQRAVVTGAVAAGALERPSAEIVLKVVAVAEGGDQQGVKAKVGGFLTTRNLVYAAASVVLGGTLAGATGQVGADVAAEFEFSKPLIRFLRQSGEAIDDLLTGAPADVRQAVEAARTVQPAPRPSPPTPTPRPTD